MNNLDQYKEKRDFKKTTEPQAKVKSGKQNLTYAIQKHKSRNLHYDLRLELDGVLKSWAVPKGPSTDPAQKRLAVPTEDHPIDYARFEGIIPEGQYGAGTVIVWDKGTYRNLKQDKSTAESLQQGKLEFFIQGKKLQGAYVLLRTGKKNDDDNRWLLIKMKDQHADARRNPTSTEPRSVLSGKTIEELEKQND
ncbi:MAG: DNA polymerase ligase N-terminal domain-containing protein [Actinomycetota bacterium]|nr:DNA polymerase ligase N-terminal domain-containing protein [Actinomycetota bacterium]